jgi:hypothetical protein
MQTHIFNAYEFENTNSEETLRVASAHKKECPSAQIFLAQCGWAEHSFTQALIGTSGRKRRRGSSFSLEKFTAYAMTEFPGAKTLRLHAARFNCFPEPLEHFTVIAVFSDFGNNTDLLLESPKRFVWYNWYTTA